MTKKKLGSNKVRQGKSSIPLKVNDKIELGQYPLNIEYEENLTYAKSNAYGTLFYGWKSFIHCPNIYVVEGVDTYVTLRANIFSNDDIVYNGEGSFKIKDKTQAKTPVVDGYATQQLPDIQSWKKKNPYYSFIYYAYLPLHYCSARSNNAEIIYLSHTKRYAVIVKLITEYVMGYTGDTVRIIARIYKANSDVIINHSDVPDNGYARVIVNGNVVGTTGINDAGYVAFDYKITEKDCGVYPVVIEYVSQDEYYDDSACDGTLFVTSKKITLPTVTAPQIWHPLGSTASIPCTFSDISLFDKIQVYIDDQLVAVEGCDKNGYLNVTDTNVMLTFNIPEKHSINYPWAYHGGHLMYIEYNDNVNHVRRRLFLPFLMIQYPTEIQVKSYGFDDTKTMIVGNNIEGTVFNTFEIKRLVEHGLITIDIDKLEVLLSLISNVDCILGIKHPSNKLFVNETGTFKVTLQSNTTVPIPGRVVKLVTTDQTYTATTDENGVATFTKKYTTSGNDNVYALFPSTETEAEAQTTPLTIEVLDLIESELSNNISSNTLVSAITPSITSFPPSGTISATFKPVPIITITQPPNRNYEVGNSIVIKAEVFLEYKLATDIPVVLRLSRTKEDDTIQNYDSLQTKKTDKNGIITFTTSSNIPSTCKYTLFIKDTDDYTQCLSDVIIVNVTRRVTSINVKLENKNIGTASILATVKAVNSDEIVKTGTINVLVGDKIVGTSTISSESTSVPLTLDTPGKYDFVVNYVGNGTYASSTNTSLTGVSIVGKATTISSNVTNNKVGSTNLEVTLLDENGSGVGEADIIVTLPDGSTCTGTTYSAGKVNIPLTSLLEGTHELTVAFNGNSKYAPASSTVSITVVKTSVKLTATTTSKPQYINDTMAFSVTAVTGDNTPISNINIVATLEAEYTDGTNTKEDLIISTDENGNATYNRTCNKRGTYGIYFHYDGSNKYEQAQTTNTVYAVRRRQTTIQKITCNPNSVTIGAKTSITATLIDTKLGTGIQGKEVKISLTSGTITSDTYTATTDENGNATIEYNVINYGSYSITAVFEGDDIYDVSNRVQSGLSVSGISVTTNAYFTDESENRVTSIPVGSKAYIKGGCLAEDNTYPSPVYIKITKPDGTSTTRTAPNSKGYFSSPLYSNFIVDIGTYTFEVYTEATNKYTESNHSIVSLQVTKVPVTITIELTNNHNEEVEFNVTVTNNGTFEGIGLPTGLVTISENNTILKTITFDGTSNTQTATLTNLTEGEHTLTIQYEGDSNHKATSTTCIVTMPTQVNIDFYNPDNWSGTPTIDAANKKITMNGSNITYYSKSSVSDLLSQTSDNTLHLLYYHNALDGRKSLGVYNPVKNSWIGYCTLRSNGSNPQGVNEEKDYKTTTTVTDGTLWMCDGQESPLTIQYNEIEYELSLMYTSQNGTKNVTVTIPLEGVDLNNYYIAFYDYRGIGMYIKDITLGGGAIMNSTLIASSTGGDTTDWIRRTGGTVETGTYDEKTCINIPSNYDWNDTVFNHEISNTGHYTLNIEFYITSGPFGLDMGLLRNLTTDNNKNISYVINNNVVLQYGQWNNEKQIVQGNDYKYDDNSWNLMTFEIVDGVIYLVLHNHLIKVSDAVTSPTWFGVRMFGGVLSVGIYHIELRKYGE